MWGLLFESFAEAFGVTRRTRPVVFTGVVTASLAFCLLSFAEGGPRGFIAVGVLLMFAISAGSQVLKARKRLWDAARRRLDDPAQRPNESREDLDLPPTSLALHHLANAVNDARRGAFLEAAHRLEKVDRERLREEENRLFEATRAMVSLGMGDARKAAQQAERALPTSSEDIDVHLGRALVADAWSDAARLRTIDEEWAAQGVEPGTRMPLPRLRAIVRLRIDTTSVEGVESWEAKALADEARAIGDEALAADLESRVRPTAYR